MLICERRILIIAHNVCGKNVIPTPVRLFIHFKTEQATTALAFLLLSTVNGKWRSGKSRYQDLYFFLAMV